MSSSSSTSSNFVDKSGNFRGDEVTLEESSLSSKSKVGMLIHNDEKVSVFLRSRYDWVDFRVKAYLSIYRWAPSIADLAKSVEMITKIVDDDTISIERVSAGDVVCQGHENYPQDFF